MKTPTDMPAVSAESFRLGILQGWNRFWFQPQSPTVLGLVRILVGLISLYVHAAYTCDLFAFMGKDAWIDLETINVFRAEAPMSDASDSWSPVAPMTPKIDSEHPIVPDEIDFSRRWDGVHPRHAPIRGYYSWSIWFHVTDPFWMQVTHGCVLLIFFLFTIGLGTRVVSVLAWLAALSYMVRHPNGQFGLDTIMVFALLYLMIGPSGAALSVDRLLSRYVRTWRTLRRQASARRAGTVPLLALRKAEGLELDPPPPSLGANYALRLLQIHLCFVYLASGLSKLLGQAWWNGTAIWGTMANPEFSPMQFTWYVDSLRFLCEHRWLWELFMSGSAFFTLAFEISFTYTVWNRSLRWFVLLGSVMLHTGIAFFMGLVTFSLMMIASVASFLPLDTVQRVLRWLTRGPDRFRLGYAPRDRRQVQVASLVRAFDPWNQVQTLEPAKLYQSDEPAQNGAESNNGTASTDHLQLIVDQPAETRWVRPSILLLVLSIGAFIGPGVMAHFGIQSPLHRTFFADMMPLWGALALIFGFGLLLEGAREIPMRKEEEILSGYALFERLTRSLRLLWPVAWITFVPGVAVLGRTWYPPHSVRQPKRLPVEEPEKVASSTQITEAADR